ncbi:MAG: alpha-hydroxy-acid oxidizing protein [Nitrosomonadales bacterium]
MTACPAGVQAAKDYLAHAQLRLDPAVWRYLQDGNGDDLTLAANERAFENAGVTSRLLADVRGGHTRVRLFDREFAHPIVLAPIAYQQLFHPVGECASAMAAGCARRADGGKQSGQPDFGRDCTCSGNAIMVPALLAR